MTTTPRFIRTERYREWLIDEPRRAVAQARAEANATRTHFEDALERAGDLVLAGYWSEARAVLALAMEA
jgi:putative SOS response-associated peptidase YedK